MVEQDALQSRHVVVVVVLVGVHSRVWWLLYYCSLGEALPGKVWLSMVGVLVVCGARVSTVCLVVMAEVCCMTTGVGVVLARRKCCDVVGCVGREGVVIDNGVFSSISSGDRCEVVVVWW